MSNHIFIETNIKNLVNNTNTYFNSRVISGSRLNINEIKFQYLGKSLIIRALVEGSEQPSYITILHFSGVIESVTPSLGIEIPTKSKVIYINQITNKNNCKVRCQCEDFNWTFKQYNDRDNSLYGRKKEIVPLIGTGVRRNPNEKSGLCKHLLATYNELVALEIVEV